jgi:hypothetical protein
MDSQYICTSANTPASRDQGHSRVIATTAIVWRNALQTIVAHSGTSDPDNSCLATKL